MSQTCEVFDGTTAGGTDLGECLKLVKSLMGRLQEGLTWGNVSNWWKSLMETTAGGTDLGECLKLVEVFDGDHSRRD